MPSPLEQVANSGSPMFFDGGETTPGTLAQTASGGNLQQGQLFQMMIDSAKGKQDYLQQQQSAYNADLDKYAQMVQQSQQPGANEAQMWGNMARAAAQVTPTWGNTGAMIANVGGAYGDAKAAEMQNNLRNQADLTKLRQNEVRALEAKDQQMQMMKALGVQKVLTPEQLRTVYSGARNEAAQIAKGRSWDSAEAQAAWIEQYAKRAVDEYRNLYQLNTGATYGREDVPKEPVISAPKPITPTETLTTKVNEGLQSEINRLSPEDHATAVRLINRIAANPSSASNDGKTLQNLLDKYKKTETPLSTAAANPVIAPPMIDKVKEAGEKKLAEEKAIASVAKEKAFEKETGENEAKKVANEPEAYSALENFDAKSNEFTSKIDEVLKHPGLPKITGAAGYIPLMGDVMTMRGTDAANVKAKLEALQSNIVLQAMDMLKANSATGSTGFGALSEKELDTLRNSMHSIQTAQDTPQMVEHLKKIKETIDGAKKRAFAKFDRQYPDSKYRSGAKQVESETGASYDAEKEARYQAWKKSRGLK